MNTNTTEQSFTTVAFPSRTYTRTKSSKYDDLLNEVRTTKLDAGQGIGIPVEFTDGRSTASISSTLSKAAKRLGFEVQIAALTDGSYAIRQRTRAAVSTVDAASL